MRFLVAIEARKRGSIGCFAWSVLAVKHAPVKAVAVQSAEQVLEEEGFQTRVGIAISWNEGELFPACIPLPKALREIFSRHLRAVQ